LKRRDFKFDVKTTIIIQFVLERPKLPPIYRLIAYQDDRTFIPAEFESRESLFSVIQSVLPEVDGSRFLQPFSDRTQIAFSGNFMMSDQELASSDCI